METGTMRTFVMVGVMACVGCAGSSDTSTLVARAGSHELTIERLTQIAASSPDLPAAPETVESLAMRWVEYSLMANRLAAGDGLIDSATVMSAAWPDVQAAVERTFRYVRVGAGAEPTPSQIDSVYAAGEVRFLKQILKRTTPDMTDAQRTALQAEIVAIRASLLGGMPWSEANAYNDDERSRPVDGSIGLIMRGQTVPAFEGAAFALAPGRLSDVVETDDGFHLIYRPALRDVRGEFTLALNALWGQQLDASYRADLVARRPISMVGDVAAAVREVVAAGPRLSTDLTSRTLASYEGGEFTGGDLSRYVRILPPQFALQARSAPDDQLVNLVRSFVIREMTAAEARDAGVVLSASDYERIVATYATQLERIQSTSGVSAAAIEDLMASGLSSEEAVGQLVDSFMQKAAESASFRISLPPALASHLLDGGDWDLYAPGVSDVVARLQIVRGAGQDSLTASGI